MKRLLWSLPLIILFSNCETPKTTQIGSDSGSGSGTASKRWNVPEHGNTGNTDGTDTLMISGSQYIPVEGRGQAGPELEGTWELEAINGKRIPERSNLKPEVTAKVAQDVEKANRTGEYARDSMATYFYQKSDTSIRITPPQGGNFHIPEKPRLSFYGLNETFSGFTGCNKISGRFQIIDSSRIDLGKSAPSTKMVCMGDYDEASFVTALNRVNAYRLTKNRLELLSGSDAVLSFVRKD